MHMKPRIEDNPIANAARKEQRKQRLGDNAKCTLCPETNPAALIMKNRTLLEKHHVLARQNDSELIIVLCRNCHAKLTESQLDAGVLSTRDNRSILEVIADCLYALAVFLQDIIDTLLYCSQQLR